MSYAGGGYLCTVTPVPGTGQPRYGLGPLHDIACGCGHRRGVSAPGDQYETLWASEARDAAASHMAGHDPRAYAMVWLLQDRDGTLWLAAGLPDDRAALPVTDPLPGAFQSAAAAFLAAAPPATALPDGVVRQAACWPARGRLTWHRAVNYPGSVPWDVSPEADWFIDGPPEGGPR